MADHGAAFLFLGPEAGLKAEEIDRVREALSRRDGGPPDEHRFFLPDDSVDDIVATLRNGSLFSSHRLVLVSGVDLIKKKSDQSMIADYCAAPAGDATLIMLADTTRVPAALERAVGGERKRIFWEMFDNQKRGWVSSHVRKRGVEIDSEAIELLLEIVANDTASLAAEIDRLAIFAGRGGRIETDTVESFVYHSREESVFTLFTYIAAGELSRALAALGKLLSSGSSHPAALCGGLLFQLRRLAALRADIDRGSSIDEAMNRAQIRGKRIRSDYATTVERYDARSLGECIAIVGDADFACRSGGTVLHQLVLETMVYQLVKRKNTISLVEVPH